MSIKYQLQCANTHTFEGWFPSIDQFEQQRDKGLLCCPMCGTGKVDRDIMSPSVGKGSKKKIGHKERVKNLKKMVGERNQFVMGSRVKEIMREVGQYIRKNYENVGPNFVKNVELAEKGDRDDKFFGTPTSTEATKLMEAGVDLFVVPEVKEDA